MNTVTITIESKHIATPEKITQSQAMFAEYNIKGVFSGTNNFDSKWTLTGTIDNLKKLINEYWLGRGFYLPDEVLSKETMNILGYKPNSDFNQADFEYEYNCRRMCMHH